MGIFGGSSSPSTDSSSKEVKEALFKQVQAESAMSNARTLISVRHILIQENIIQDIVLTYLSPLIERQRTLLRSLRSQSRNLHVRRRTGLPDRLHGEVHRLLEHR